MAPSLLLACGLLAVVLCVDACRRAEPPQLPPRAPRTSGVLTLDGLRAPVTVRRDEWGVPHISATNTDDLFFAQGFVQAQDRLFQMDLWKRAAQGRLSEVLGSNFIERDAMTRRIRFRGHLDEEWAAYGADARSIATAFTSGINAWVRMARTDLPEEFVLAGWQPEFWKPEDLLTRTDAFLASGNAMDELFRARLAGAIGLAKTDALLPRPDGQRTTVDSGLDLSAITFVVPDAVRRIGTAPFVAALAARVTDAPRASAANAGEKTSVERGGAAPNTEGPTASASLPNLVRPGARAVVVAREAAGGDGPLVLMSEAGAADVPSRRYLVHLQAPGWNVAGATSPWMPGVAIGHNDRMAWAMTPSRLDTQDLFVERYNPDNPHQVRRADRWVDMDVDIERIGLRGRDQPFEYERQYTSNGVVIAIDKDRHLLYTLRWSGTEPGGAAELAALQVDRARTGAELEQALAHWQMPVVDVVYADADGGIGRTGAGLIPARRKSGSGATPQPAWAGTEAWTGFVRYRPPSPPSSLRTMAIGSDGESYIGLATNNEVLTGIDGFLHRRIVPVAVGKILSHLEEVGSLTNEVDVVRMKLLALRQKQVLSEDESALLGVWLTATVWDLSARLVPNEFRELLAVSLLQDVRSIDRILKSANGASVGQAVAKGLADVATRAADVKTAVYVHPLAAFPETRRRFNVGPVELPESAQLISMSGGHVVPLLNLSLDVGTWDRSRFHMAPGQAGSPASLHYDDLAARWSSGRAVNLLFDQNSVSSGANETLELIPGHR